MIKRILLLLCSKLKCLFAGNLSFSSRIEYSKISSKAKVNGHCKIFHSFIGDYSYVGNNQRLVYTKVGKFCSIAGDGIIGMGTHTLSNLSTSPIFTAKRNGTGYSWTNEQSNKEYKETTIGNDVWIGARVLIIGGISIGDGAVIGAGAVVTKNVPPYAIVVGVPAKILRYRFPEEVISRLLEVKWWDVSEEKLKERISLFQRESLTIKDINEYFSNDSISISQK